jgi:hypothetical protein
LRGQRHALLNSPVHSTLQSINDSERVAIDDLASRRSFTAMTTGATGQPEAISHLGIGPTPMQAVLEDYLYAYRPAGQYTEIQESALRVRP